jgi:DNA polymerase III delta prime subunit
MSNVGIDNLWVEKYRPKNLQETILSDENYKLFNKFIEQKEIPNLLFYGIQGTGKTSMAYTLVNAIDAEYIYKNCAEVGIDEVRTTITNFSRTKSYNGNIKVVLLDEIDAASTDAQRGLRNTMEENSAYCRYILTCNYIHRVIAPLQSRCQSFQLNPPIKNIVKRAFEILSKEKISTDEQNQIKLAKLVKRLYPDIRKIINETQKFSVDGKLLIPDITQNESFADKLIRLVLNKKALDARRFIIENENDFKGDYQLLIKSIFDCICNNNYNLSDERKKMWLVVIGEYLYKSAFVVDQEINCYCLLLALTEVN